MVFKLCLVTIRHLCFELQNRRLMRRENQNVPVTISVGGDLTYGSICAELRIVWSRFKPWPSSLCSVLGQQTLFSRCLSKPRCINGYRRIDYHPIKRGGGGGRSRNTSHTSYRSVLAMQTGRGFLMTSFKGISTSVILNFNVSY